MALTYDPDEAVAHLAQADRRLAALIDAAGPFTMRPDPLVDTFEYLVRSIIYQQLAGKAAKTIHGRLLDLYDGSTPEPEALLATDAATLRTAGVSGNKARALHSLAELAAAGDLPSAEEARRLGDDELVRSLTQVRGIGPWTVHMLLMFRLGRPDVLPTGDYGVRKGFQLTYRTNEMPTPTELTKAATRWQPYRSVASWYLWRAVDLEAGTTIKR